MTADLVTWLTQVWDEDEALATSALDLSKVHIPTGDGYEIRYTWMRELLLNDKLQSGWTMEAASTPASVLTRVAADRKILALHAQTWDQGRYETCDTCWGEWPCVTARLLAQPYADREGWQEAWRVTA